MHADNAFSKVCRAGTSLIIITILLSLFSVNLFTVLAQQITGTTLLQGNITCVGDMVVFTCETVGSEGHGLAWRSDDYIGTGGTEISFLAGDISDRRRKNSTDYDTYAILTDVNNHNGQLTLTSKLYINASVSRSTVSSVMCRHTDENVMATQEFQVFSPPGAPNNLIAVRIVYMDLIQCFYTAIWQRPTVTDSYQAEVTNYTVSLNGTVKFNKTVGNTSDVAEFSASFQDTCETGHMINVTADSICGTGPSVMYTMDQEECSGLKIENIPESCFANHVGLTPSTTQSITQSIIQSTTNRNKGEISNGNVNIIAISGFLVTTILLLGSW